MHANLSGTQAGLKLQRGMLVHVHYRKKVAANGKSPQQPLFGIQCLRDLIADEVYFMCTTYWYH